MRVSERMLFDSLGSRMQSQSASLFRLQEQITGGKRINRPSDDPIGQAAVIRFDQSLKSSDQYLRNIDRLTSFVSASEGALQAVQDQLVRARSLAIQGANATNTAADRAIIAQEVRQIYDQLIALANAKHEGAYIFSGNEILTEPLVNQGFYTGSDVSSALPVTITLATNDTLTLSIDGVASTITLSAGAYATGAALAAEIQTQIAADTTFQNANVSAALTFNGANQLVLTSNAVGGTSAVIPTGGTAQTVLGLSTGTSRPAGSYLGDSEENAILIGDNISMVKNLPGDRVFKGAGGGTDLFSIIGALQSALETNSVTGIQSALSNLTGIEDGISNERVLLGARLNRADTTAATLEDFKLTVSRIKSDIEDTDLPMVISELLLQESTLEATRAVSARILQRSLLDFLR